MLPFQDLPLPRQGRAGTRYLFFAMVVLGYAVAGLYPFDFDLPIRRMASVTWLPQAGVQFSEPGILRTDGPPTWVAEAIQFGELEIELRVKPSALQQTGPARVLTLSKDNYFRNLTIAQDGDELVVRLRTKETSPNGTPELRLQGCLNDRSWIDIRVNILNDMLQLSINGEPRLARDLPESALAAWDPA